MLTRRPSTASISPACRKVRNPSVNRPIFIVHSIVGVTTTTRKDIAALTSLRGIAALTVLIFHTNTWNFRGYLGVDLFFLLSGFVLAYVYGQMELSRQTYCSFLKARLARVYPVHLLILVLILALMLPMIDTRPDFSTGGLLSSRYCYNPLGIPQCAGIMSRGRLVPNGTPICCFRFWQ